MRTSALRVPCSEQRTARRGLSTGLKGERIARGKRLSPVFSSPREAAKAFQAELLHLSVGELASSIDTNKETAKCWKAGRAFPSGLNLMALMAQFPTIRKWVEEQVSAMGGHTGDPQIVSEVTRRVLLEMRGRID